MRALSLLTLLVAFGAPPVVAHAQEAAAPAAPTVAARKPAAPHPRPAARERETVADPTRCHPTEDIACTVVRETSQGTLIVTVRTPGSAARPSVWSVVSGTPPAAAGPALGGTVYVVPAAPAVDGTRPPANGAPILD